MLRTIICKNCQQEETHYAKGFCKGCYTQDYYSKNHSQCIESSKRWRRANRDKHRAYARNYREKYPEKARAMIVRWETANIEKVREAGRRWAKKHRKRANAILRSWRKRNPEKARLQSDRRRAIKVGADGYASAKQIMARIEYYGGLCYLCGAPYEAIDHVIPLSRGGSNWPANQRPICTSCNSSKGNRRLDRKAATWNKGE